MNNGSIAPASLKVSCTCTRVPVLDGHTESVFVETEETAEAEEVKNEMLKFSKNVSIKGLPTAPKDYIVVHDDPTRPQPRIDRELNDGMTTVVGRLRKDTAFDNGIKYVLLSHNEKMGSAPVLSLAAIGLATAAFVVAWKQRSFLVAGLLVASGIIFMVPALNAMGHSFAVIVFPGPILGVIFGLVIFGLGVAKGIRTARAVTVAPH